MADTPELGFSVDTSELEKATKALDDVTKAAERTEQAAGKTGQSGRKMASDFVPAVDQTKNATDSASAAAERYLKQLQAQFDMLGKSSSAQAAYRTAMMGGTEAQQKQAAALATLIDKRKEGLESQAMEEAGLRRSTKAMGDFSLFTAGSTRELIVLAHEAVSGNFSRMPGSFMVLMERVGGLHDALRALATPLGMVGTVGVASAVAVAVAFYEGAQETKAFNNALSLTSNYAGLTADSFEVMARKISQANYVSTGSVREILDQLIHTGQVGAPQIGLITDAAERYASVTSTEASDAAKRFAKALEDPAKGAIELNKEMHFLTLAQYEHIVALQKTGREQEAQTALARALDDHMKTVSEPTLGTIQLAWKGVAMAVRDAWDAMKGWGRESGNAEKIAANNAKIAQLSIPGRGGIAGTLLHKDEIAALQAENVELHKKMERDNEEAQRKSTVAQVNQEGIAARARYQAFLDKFATPAQRRQQEITKIMQDFDKMIMAGETVTQKQRDDAIQAVNDKYKDKKVPTPKIDHALKQEDQEIARANAAILEAKQQIALLNLGDEKSAEKVTAAQKEINRLLEMRKMNLQSRPGKVSDGQIDTEIEAWRKAQVVQEEEQRLRRQKTLEMTANKFSSETTTKWGISDAKTLDKYRQEAELIGQSANQRKLYAAALAIEEEQRSAIAQLMEKTGAKTEEELTQQYPKQVAAINEAAQARREKMIPALEDEISLSQQWSTGWDNAFASFQDSAHNNATAAASVFNTMTSSMQSTLISFFNTGKMGWKSFASAILVEIERIMVAKMAAGLLSSATSFFTGGGAASTAGGVSSSSSGYSFQGFGTSSSTFALQQANGGGWMNGVQFYANGDVFNSPTMFSHSGGLGVLGEAGPEAVMPLTRGSDGKLGVKASGSTGGGSVQIQQTFYIGQDGSTQQTGDAGQLSSVTQQMSDAMTTIAKASILQEMQPGGSIARVYGTKQ